MEAVEALLATASAKPRGRQPVLIDTFLAAVRSLSDATPSDKDLEVTKQFLRLLNDQTAVDHLKSVDEMIAQVPTEVRLDAVAHTCALELKFVFCPRLPSCEWFRYLGSQIQYCSLLRPSGT